MISSYKTIMEEMYQNANKKQKANLARDNIKTILLQAEQLREIYPEATPRQIRDIMKRDLEEGIRQYAKKGNNFLGRHIQYFSVEYLLNNKDKARQLFDKYKKDNSTEKIDKTYPFEITKAARLVIREIVRSMNIHKLNKDYDNLDRYLNTAKKHFEKTLRKEHVNMLEMAGEFFKKYNLLDSYNSSYNSRLNSAGVHGIEYKVRRQKSHNKKDKQELSIEDAFTEEHLNGLDMHTLMTVTTFWQNRMAKDFKEICIAFYIIDELNILAKGYTSKDLNKIPTKKIRKLIARKLFVNRLAVSKLRLSEEEINSDYYKDKIKKYSIEYERDYRGNLREEISRIELEQVNNENIYLLKDHCIANLIKMLIEEKSKIINWGIVPEKSNDNKVLICIDLPGYNMPVSLHIPTDSLLLELNALNTNKRVEETQYIIPIYAGDYDFEIYGKHLPTNLLMPLTEDQKRNLKTQAFNSKEGNKNYKLLQHLYANSKGEIPTHLKEIEVRNNVKYIKMKKKFYDLVRKKTYEKDKTGKYVDYIGGTSSEGRE